MSMVNTMVVQSAWPTVASILCISVEYTEVLYTSLNLAAMFVCMAKHFRPGHPPLYPAKNIEMHDQENQEG